MFKKKHFLELIQDVKLEKFSKFFNFYRWININETENIENYHLFEHILPFIVPLKIWI